MRYLSTFSGIGGAELGIERAYGKTSSPYNALGATPDDRRKLLQGTEPPKASCVGYSEIDKYAIQIYERHYPDHRNLGDITKVNAGELPDFDLLVGGFPCQAFSVAGKRQGFADTRGTLFFDLARILEAKRPQNFIFENVKGLLSHDGGRTFATIVCALDELGYCIEWQVLNSKDWGVPQNRERVYIVGHLGGEPARKVFPLVPAVGEGDGEHFTAAGINNPSRGYEMRRDGLSTCVRATEMGSKNFMYRKGDYHIRRLTPKECERLQGFPDGWTEGVSDTQRYKTLGNAMTVNVVEAVISKLYDK